MVDIRCWVTFGLARPYLLQEKYPLPVEQFVIYLGKSRPRMRHRLVDLVAGEKTDYAFSLINIQDYAYQTLLASDVPEEILLAVLSDFRNENPTEIVRQILICLVRASADTTKLRRYIRQLTVLAGLRNLRGETHKQLQDKQRKRTIQLIKLAGLVDSKL